jgi:hypothetical protein
MRCYRSSSKSFVRLARYPAKCLGWCGEPGVETAVSRQLLSLMEPRGSRSYEFGYISSKETGIVLIPMGAEWTRTCC